VATENREDGQYATVRVARTAAGDDMLALAEDRILRHASIEFLPVPGGTRVGRSGGRRYRKHGRVQWTGLSLTYRPAYQGAEVLAVRTAEEEQPMAEAVTSEAVQVTTSQTPTDERVVAALESVSTALQARTAADDGVASALDRIEKLEEQARSSFVIPAKSDDGPPSDFGRGHWMQTVLRMMSGERVSQRELETRIAADLITTDNLGVVPEAFLRELIGIIDQSRPFLSSVRRLTTPSGGMSLTVPVLETRPTVGLQAEEKDELTSTPTSITSETFNAVSVGGYGDISLQLLKRSDPSYLEMYVDLLAEAYAIDADDRAVDVLLAATGINDGGTVVADDGPQFGQAWANAVAVSRRLAPDRIWMSSSAVQAFIDAKNDTTNSPLYADLAGAFSAAGGAGGTISGLRPVHVPALDDESYDIIVGPSRGFAYAEDGTYTLQVDVPAKAGRDVAIFGMLWFAPLYPAAFTRYALGS
jgi:HK97 family phage major capsid protein